MFSIAPSQAAYLLISHGSRDPRPQQAVDDLATTIRQRLTQQQATPLVGTAVLELADQPLYQQIVAFAEDAIRQGYQRLFLLPLFLLPGVHVMEDIPQEVALAERSLAGRLTLSLQPYLGRAPQLRQLLLDKTDGIVAAPQTGRILLGHGSRRPDGNQPIEDMAVHLSAIPAYWSVPPQLETQVQRLVQLGYRQIAILPYFLFAGGLTDSLEQTVYQLTQLYPEIRFYLAAPIGSIPTFAEIVMEFMLP